jgi:hypothetical protein
MLSGSVLITLVLLTGPLRHLRDLPSREAKVEARASQAGTERPARFTSGRRAVAPSRGATVT